MTFTQRLHRSWKNSLLCLGLDFDPEKFPLHLRALAKSDNPKAVEQAFCDFCLAIVEKVAPFICAVKPQIAFFSACRAESALENITRHIKHHFPHLLIILDAKRSDIGNTATQYAREAFVRYQADAVTLSPYMGYDSIAPFLSYQDKGVFILCRTSNERGADFQECTLKNGQLLYEYIANTVATEYNTHKQCGLVVGASSPEALRRVRVIAPDIPLLIPGIGAQQGDLATTLNAGLNAQKTGVIINSSRAILYADDSPDFAQAATLVARDTHNAIKQLCTSTI